MKTTTEPAFQGLVDKINAFMERDNPIAARLLDSEELSIGRESASGFRTSGAAMMPIAVGDAAHVLPEPSADAAIRALFKAHPEQVLKIPRWRPDKQKFEIMYRRATRDGVADAAPDLITAQLLAAPGLVGYFEQLFRKPLLYFHARDLVKIFQGSSPWAEVLTLYSADYAGAAAGPEYSGSPESNYTEDVNAQSYLMTSPVVNIITSYSLSIEELERAKGGTMPFGSQLIDSKRSYADYALELATAALIIYGNASSETQGLLGVGAGVQPYLGDSAETIANDAGETSKGSRIYQALAKIIGNFLTRSYNKFNKVRIACSPGYYNLLGWVPYSDVYNPDAPRVQILKNFLAGGKEGGNDASKKIDIELIVEPLLSPNTPFNPHEFDITIITAPEIEAGPEEVNQPIVVFGAPLMRFVFPTIPGQYITNYKIMRRVSGVYAPVIDGVESFYGLGFQPSDT